MASGTLGLPPHTAGVWWLPGFALLTRRGLSSIPLSRVAEIVVCGFYTAVSDVDPGNAAPCLGVWFTVNWVQSANMLVSVATSLWWSALWDDSATCSKGKLIRKLFSNLVPKIKLMESLLWVFMLHFQCAGTMFLALQSPNTGALSLRFSFILEHFDTYLSLYDAVWSLCKLCQRGMTCTN